MNPSPLHHKLFETFLISVLPIILLCVIARLLFPKKFQSVVIIGVLILTFLPSEGSFIAILLLLIICVILIGFLAVYSFSNQNDEEFDDDLYDLLHLSIPLIIVTPPSEPHLTNLPPQYKEQDANFLMVLLRSGRRRRRNGNSRSRSRSSNRRKGARWMALFLKRLSDTSFHELCFVWSFS
ncbi:uncharacterized protein MELLADRAFT_124053 [Melampsora larici-populina 98AG31]|uniref:Secreted protein n=1 Tax=Melampsora larici-populina (strain 98AG31 / pathotype 3-4-7) TaxID=747676 RepID=F4RGK7_MELLP|nr:uncharacterized protein MELLADRAFT_124053 [Melampsora larici-populina 98AG31]EGG08524.1 secreted protein [Melampsora larici-populina 98AG31]